MSPLVAWKVFAMRSIIAGDGLSLTKRMASLVEMKCAVFGLVASMWRTSKPSLGPLSLMMVPRTNLGPGSCLEASNSGLDVIGGEGSLADRPAGEDLGDLGDVVLGVSAVDSDGVELHEFAGVVFVEAAGAFFLVIAGTVGELGVGADAGGVVEIVQHGGAGGSGYEEIFKAAEGDGTDRIALVTGYVIRSLLRFSDVDIEVIEPEVDHDFLKLALSVDVAEELGLGCFGGDDSLWAGEGSEGFELLGGEAVGEVLALLGGERATELLELGGLHFAECGEALVGGQVKELGGGFR